MPELDHFHTRGHISNMDQFYLCFDNCGTKLVTHFHTATVQALQFEKGKMISSHTI